MHPRSHVCDGDHFYKESSQGRFDMRNTIEPTVGSDAFSLHKAIDKTVPEDGASLLDVPNIVLHECNAVLANRHRYFYFTAKPANRSIHGQCRGSRRRGGANVTCNGKARKKVLFDPFLFLFPFPLNGTHLFFVFFLVLPFGSLFIPSFPAMLHFSATNRSSHDGGDLLSLTIHSETGCMNACFDAG